MTAEQPGSTTDRIAELERKIAAAEADHPDDIRLITERDSYLRTWRAELSRLRNEPASEVRTYPFYGYAPGNYWCNCVEPGCESKIPGFPGLGKFIGDKRAIRCEPCAEKVAARKLSEVGSTPSPPSVEAGRGEREALAEKLWRASYLRRGKQPPYPWNEIQHLERSGYLEEAGRVLFILPNIAALQGNGEAVAWHIRERRNGKLTRGYIEFKREYAEQRQKSPDQYEVRALVYAAPPSNPNGVRTFAQAILHGDDEHKAWLLEAAENFISGKPLPPPRGKGTQAAQPDGVQEALDKRIYSTPISDAVNGAYEVTFGFNSRAHAEALIVAICTTLPSRTGLEEAAEWLPIDTAPRDKTMVALLFTNGNFSRTGVGWYMPLNGWQAWNFDKGPTHWLPLPPPSRTRAAKTTAPAANREGDRE